MVKVYQVETPTSPQDSGYQQWCLSLYGDKANYPQAVWDKINTAMLQSAPEDKAQAAALYAQSFEMANILSSLGASNQSMLAAILYPFVERQLLSLSQVSESVSTEIAAQLKGVATMDVIRSLQEDFSGQSDSQQIDNLRKMLLAMVDDVRVVLIKLAERLYLLRLAVKQSGDEPVRLAREIQDVYAPLANRLGVGQIKWEMEDLAFRVLHSQDYKAIAKSLDGKRVARETYVDQVLSIIGEKLTSLGIEADLQGRAKHIYSIWKKMQRKQVGFEEIYDVRAVRVLVPEVQDCYSVLGVVHGLWKHIPKEFDDYIATPKQNGYRSLHTAVVGPEGKTLEIQIRTFAMHQESELGVAAHWKYKEGTTGVADSYESKIAWLRQLLEWQDEVTGSAELVEEFRNQVREERVYVFTPAGKLIDLPQGATAVDFAYRVHTQVGHRCRGAKVNGRIIPLTQALETGQKVEIMTAKAGGPSRDWLSEHQGYLRSSRARSKVHQWFRHQDKDKNTAAGKTMLEKELAKHNIKNVDMLALAKKFNFNREEELYAAIGIGDKGVHQVLNSLRAMQPHEPTVDPEKIIKKKSKASKGGASDVLVEGVGNLLTKVAGCCKPVPGDEIKGYVTHSRGIMIHRSDCSYLLNAQRNAPEKVLDVEWTSSIRDSYFIDLLIKAYDRQGLLGDVTTLLAEEKVNVTALNTHKNVKQLQVSIQVQVEVPSISVVSRLMSKIEQLPTVVSVRRR